jgi:hypothetical protein
MGGRHAHAFVTTHGKCAPLLMIVQAKEALERSPGQEHIPISPGEDGEQESGSRLRLLGRRGSASRSYAQSIADAVTNDAGIALDGDGSDGDGQGGNAVQQSLPSQPRRMFRGRESNSKAELDEILADGSEEASGDWDDWIVEPLPEDADLSGAARDASAGLRRGASDRETQAESSRSACQFLLPDCACTFQMIGRIRIGCSDGTYVDLTSTRLTGKSCGSKLSRKKLQGAVHCLSTPTPSGASVGRCCLVVASRSRELA